mgnify:CR=1 FL=1
MSNTCGCDAQTNYIPSQKRLVCFPEGSEQTVIDNKQRIIQGTVRASAGEYLMNKKEVSAYGNSGSKLDNGTKPIQKHDSYARYLAKKKGGGVIREQSDASRASSAVSGGKTKRLGMFGFCSSSC